MSSSRLRRPRRRKDPFRHPSRRAAPRCAARSNVSRGVTPACPDVHTRTHARTHTATALLEHLKFTRTVRSDDSFGTHFIRRSGVPKGNGRKCGWNSEGRQRRWLEARSGVYSLSPEMAFWWILSGSFKSRALAFTLQILGTGPLSPVAYYLSLFCCFFFSGNKFFFFGYFYYCDANTRFVTGAL